ncbi:MAG: polyribonucleotide nucleotidyltransferase, partial [Firmicutes bacterium]|nr:polyribonucleotide nucleotidyltransferase [Bacillota bacterium]
MKKKENGLVEFETTIGGKTVIVETGKYCGQASGSCWVRCGDTVVMTNVTMAGAPRAGIDFFPLGVDYEEKQYSVGRIPGGFKKREGRASDKAILTSRLIDRPLRPLFPKGFFNDVSVVSTVLSVDANIAPEVFGMLGSSIALSISDIPFAGPTGSVVIGMVDGKFVVNPDLAQRALSKLHLVVSGTADAILMIEAGADIVSEDTMIEAVLLAHSEIKKQVAFINEIVKAVGKPKKNIEYYTIPAEIDKDIRNFADKKLEKVLDSIDRVERQEGEEEVEKKTLEYFAMKYADKTREIKDVLYNMTKEKVRAKITQKGQRPDGRSLTQIRPIWSEVGVLPRTHGSAIFTRGQTQA